MNLLILTQKVDRDDPILGFFHRWIESFARRSREVRVICLEEGSHSLPDNVRVLSLGKTSADMRGLHPAVRRGKRGYARMKYVVRFYRYIWQERKKYDAVFVHMNQGYVLLGGLIWRLLGKRVFLWYNHTVGTVRMHAAARLAHGVFHTSPFAYTARFKNAVRMPAGIDTDAFASASGEEKQPNSLLYVGRLSPLKNVHVLLAAVRTLVGRGVSVRLSLYGDAPERDRQYLENLKREYAPLIEKRMVSFCGSVPNRELPRIYSRHSFFVNLTPRGNFDKTVLEAMASETPVVVSSDAFSDMVPEECMFREGDARDLAGTLERMFAMSDAEKEKLGTQLRKKVQEKHDLSLLAEEIKNFLHNPDTQMYPNDPNT